MIEILIGLGVAAVMLPAVFTGIMATREGRISQTTYLDSSGLMHEMYEAVRVVRARGWTNFAVNGVYHPSVVLNQWQLLANSEVVNGLTRSIQIADARRDAGGNIVSQGGSVDPSTKKLVLTVG